MELSVKFSEAQDRNFPVEFAETDAMSGADFGSFQTLKGDPGASAYEIAVANGFHGTELQWLQSLHGRDGRDGVSGKNGYTPVKGVDYFDGADGKNGKDGYTPVKGVDYFDGKDGAAGYTPVKGVDYSDGKDGRDGVDGKTPVKGMDYFTETDRAEMVSDVIAALPVYKGEVVAE